MTANTIAVMKVYLENTDEYDDFEITDVCELDGTEAGEFSEVIVPFIKEKLGKGIFEVIVKVEVSFYQSNHPLDPVEYDVDLVSMEILGFAKFDTSKWDSESEEILL